MDVGLILTPTDLSSFSIACASSLPSEATCGFQLLFGTITSAPLLPEDPELFK